MFRIDSLSLGIADTDPETDQNSCCNQKSVGWQAKRAYVKESREHLPSSMLYQGESLLIQFSRDITGRRERLLVRQDKDAVIVAKVKPTH